MSDSFISVRCPRCNSLASVRAEQAGKTVACRHCENEMLVPGQPKNVLDSSMDGLISLEDDVLAPIELTDWSNYRRSNPRKEETDKPDVDSKKSETRETIDSESEVAPVDDLDELLITVTRPSVETGLASGKDPFEVDKFAPLKIDGITPSDSEFSVTCYVCGTLMHARLSQVGTEIKCHDCYSMVKIAAPRKGPEVKGKPSPETPQHEYREEEGYRLEAETRLQPMDTTIDLSLGKIDYDDDDFFSRRRELEAADPEIYDDEYELAPPSDDAAPTRPLQTVFEPIGDLLAEYPAPASKGAIITDSLETDRPITVVPIDESGDADKSEVGLDRRKEAKGDDSKPKAEKSLKKKSSSASTEDITSPFAGLGGWIASSLSIVMQPLNLARIGMGTVALGFGYLMFFSGLGNFDPEAETETINKFGGYLLMGFGSVPIVLTFFLMAVHSSSIIRDAIEQRSSKGEWPDFSIADFAGQFVYVGTSFWLAAVPGLIVGQILWIVTDFVYCLPACVMVSSVLLAPFFMSSVVFNGSPLALVSGEAFVSISKFRNRWIRYWIATFLIAIAFAGALAGASLGTGFAFLFSVIQLSLAIVLFWMVGDMTGYVIRLMEQKGES